MKISSISFAALAVSALACSGSGPGGPGDPPQTHELRWGLVDETTFAVTDWGSLETCASELALDGSGTPLLAWYDGMAYGAARMHRYSKPFWSELGGVVTQPKTAMQMIAASRTVSGDPVLVRVDPSTHDVIATRWTGSIWEDLGTAIPGNGSYWLRAAAGPDGPMVAWLDYGPASGGYSGRVARWNGTDWIILGTARPVFPPSGTNPVVQLSIAVAPSGDPVVAYIGASDTLHVDRWDAEGLSTWVALPAPPAPPNPAKNVSVAVDGDGAVYFAPSYLTGGEFEIAAVYRLAPDATAWTSLGKPPSNGLSASMVALHGLQGSGVFAGWTGAFSYYGGGGEPELARWTPAGWERVVTSWGPDWSSQWRPRIQPVSDTDVWFGFNDQTTLHVTRWQLLP